MEESESSSTSSTSPIRSKRPSEPDVQEPAPKQSKKKSNSTSIHQEFTRFKFTKGGEERLGSRCNVCAYEMMDINPTNLKLHYKRKHPTIYETVMGKKEFL